MFDDPINPRCSDQQNKALADGRQYYYLETYLFETVRDRFHACGWLYAFDFFSIIIWKANRAKTRVAKKILANRSLPASADLDARIRRLTESLFAAQEDRQRLRLLIEDWGFRLPMATSVLSVLWPDTFTVYDARLCDELKDHRKLVNLSHFDKIWQGYEKYRAAVLEHGPQGLSLRDKDRWLWGTNIANQLKNDIKVWNQSN